MEVESPGYRAPNEVEFLDALRRGEEAAFAELVRRHSGRLLVVIRRLLRRDEDAQDALQETFLSAFRGLSAFDGKCQLGTWLHRIAVNSALMKLRSQQRKPERSIEEFLPTFYADGHRQNPGPAWKVDVDRALDQAETRDLVRWAIDQLPDAYRVVLILRDIDQLDTAEAAALLEADAGAVKTRLHRARQALRTLLDPHFRGDAT